MTDRLAPIRFRINFKAAIRWVYTVILIPLLVPDTASAQKYWQQEIDYDIRVSLDDKKHILNAQASILYHNHSPQELNFIWFHLWPNAYKDRTTALSEQLKEDGRTRLYFSKPEQRGYIDSLDFRVNGVPVKVVNDSLHPDIVKLVLTAPLKSGDSITITTPFRVKLPQGSISRLGHTGQQYLITQWYPKPAVYDSKGWHPMTYLHTGEFYSEYGSYRVSLTLPENYVVAATGVLQDTSELRWLMEKANQPNLQPADSMRFPTSSSALKTITYTADSVHDFAFFADKRYLVGHDTLLLPSGRTIDCFTFVTPRNADKWKNSMQYIKKSVLFFSEKLGEYPYPVVAAADGLENAGTDMEYPMVTVLGTPLDEFMLEDLIIHEIGHNWFYAILGTNERRYPYMDEGLNTALELWYMTGKNGNDLWGVPGLANSLIDADGIDLNRASLLRYRLAAAAGEDQQASLSAEEYSQTNYGAIVYYKTGVVFNYLRLYLGDSVFTSGLRKYYSDWSFKHSYPEDLQAAFESVSGEKLDWFFTDLLATTKKSDAYPRISKDGTTFSIADKGSLNIPVPYTVYSSDNQIQTGFALPGSEIRPKSSFDKVVTGSEFYPEVNTRNNISRTTGIFRHKAPIRLSMWPLLQEKDLQHTWNIVPVPAWNTTNNWMAGVSIHNLSIVPKPFEFSITPLYDFSHGAIAGTARMQYTFVPDGGFFQSIAAGISGKRFGQYKNLSFPNYPELTYELLSYNKIEPFIRFSVRKSNPRSSVSHSFLVRNSQIWQEEINYLFDGVNYYPEKQTAHLQFNELEYSLTNSRTVDPFRTAVVFEQSEDQLKASLEFSYTLSYAKYGKGIKTRLFAGYFLVNEQTERNYNFRMSGWGGDDDYKYDYYYFGRNDQSGIWNKQFMIRDGGFITPTAVGQTNEWLAAVNIHADMPMPVPVKFFMNIGTYKGIKDVFPDIGNTYMYDGGLALSFGEAFEVYFPLFYSDDIDTSLETNDISFKETIRFVLNINKLSLQQIRDTLTKWF